MLPWVIEMIMRIVPAAIVSDPTIVLGMNVWRFGMARLIAVILWPGLLLYGPLRSHGSRPPLRNVTVADSLLSSPATLLNRRMTPRVLLCQPPSKARCEQRK